MISICFQGKIFNITVIYVPTTNAKEAEVEWFYDDLQDLRELTPKKDVFFIIGDWHAKVRRQEIPEVTCKFSLEVQNEAGKRLIELCQENPQVIANTLFEHHQMVNIEIRLIIFFAAEDEEALYSQQKQDQELTVAHIMNSLR